jgi:hypothetical protein
VEVAHFFPSKTQHQVNERWQKVLNPDLVKGSWTGTEDRVIVAWVAEHGLKDWSALAAQLPGRIGKQCRERWHNHLSPLVIKSDWTEEEDKVLIECHQKWGNKWSRIAEFLHGRTDNAIKNRWNSSLRRWIERIENGLNPVGKRGRRPKLAPRPSMPSPDVPVKSPEKASLSVSEVKGEVAHEAEEKASKLDALIVPTFGERRPPFSPGLLPPPVGMWSPLTGIYWSPDLGSKSPSRPTISRVDFANIPAPKFDE